MKMSRIAKNLSAEAQRKERFRATTEAARLEQEPHPVPRAAFQKHRTDFLGVLLICQIMKVIAAIDAITGVVIMAISGDWMILIYCLTSGLVLWFFAELAEMLRDAAINLRRIEQKTHAPS